MGRKTIGVSRFGESEKNKLQLIPQHIRVLEIEEYQPLECCLRVLQTRCAKYNKGCGLFVSFLRRNKQQFANSQIPIDIKRNSKGVFRS